MNAVFPTTFPSGQGSDLAGTVGEFGPGVTNFAVGDEVLGFVNTRSSQAELVVADEGNLASRPAKVPWDAAGALFVAGTTAYATVRAVNLRPGDTVVVSGAAGGVGSIAVQLATIAGAAVIGLASQGHHRWLSNHGVIPVGYGDGVVERLREASNGRVDAFVDTFGSGYVDMAIELGVASDRIETTIDLEGAQKYGTKTDGNAAAGNAAVLSELLEGSPTEASRFPSPRLTPSPTSVRPTANSSSVTRWARSSSIPRGPSWPRGRRARSVNDAISVTHRVAVLSRASVEHVMAFT